MKSEKLRLYTIELALIIFLLLAMIFNNIFTRQIISIGLLVFMVLCLILIKTNKLKQTNSKQIIILLSAFGVIYIAIIYILGIFIGFYEATVKLSWWSIKNYIIPYIVIIVSSEIIRKTILLTENKKSKIIITIAMIILDMVLYTSIDNLKTAKDYFTLLSFVIFSAIANNMLFYYIVTKYRNWVSIIIYRIITTLYAYIIPIIPDIHVFFESIIKLIIPYVIYIILQSAYSKNDQVVSVQQKRKGIIKSIISCVIVALIIMLVSCKFRFCALIIGSGSMTGTINKGDIIIYERYENKEPIQTGDIIVFKREDILIVHRVIDQRDFGNETRYYTKGDANIQEDEGYRIKQDVVGKVRTRIPYIGYLTLWVNDIFE